MEPYLRAAPDHPPIWAETPKLSAVGEKAQKTLKINQKHTHTQTNDSRDQPMEPWTSTQPRYHFPVFRLKIAGFRETAPRSDPSAIRRPRFARASPRNCCLFFFWLVSRRLVCFFCSLPELNFILLEKTIWVIEFGLVLATST